MILVVLAYFGQHAVEEPEVVVALSNHEPGWVAEPRRMGAMII